MANEAYLGFGNDDGTIFGAATDKISFYGAAPIAKQTCIIVANASTTAITSVAADLYSLISTLKTLGLFNTATS